MLFAFIPARYDASLLASGGLPGGLGAQAWTFVTYAFLHGSWAHLGFNSIWFLPFGAALARRFGTARFLAFFVVTAAAGALIHLLTHAGSLFPVIGASAAISGAMAAAMRFAFQRGGPLGFWRHGDDEAYRVPALPLTGVLRDPRVLAFLVVWFGINLIFGAAPVSLTGDDAPVAWEAHIGGFLAGLCCSRCLTRRGAQRAIESPREKRRECAPYSRGDTSCRFCISDLQIKRS